MSRMADVIVDELIAAGLDTAFGVPGESYLAVLDAIALRKAEFRFITCRHEGGAAMAAEAYGKLTGKPGLCMVTRGPGAANAASGIHVARQDSTPMIMLIGQIETKFRHREAFQEVDFEVMFAPLAKWAAEIREPERASEYINRAISCATSGRPGPVVLSLPEDLLGRTVPPSVRSRAPSLHVAAPTDADIDAAAKLLADARRPLIVAGGGGWTGSATDRLREFSEEWAIPVAAAWRRQDVLENSHPHYVGHVGLGIDPALAKAIDRSDLLLVVGARLGEATTSGYSLLRAPFPRQHLIHIHPDADELGQVYSATIGIPANYAETLLALAKRASKRRKAGAWLRRLRAAYEHFSTPTPDQVALEPSSVVRHLSEHLSPDATIANGAGNYAIWLHRFFRYRSFGTQLSPTSGSMGYGLPAAVAAATLRPDAPAVCLAGDGCFMMTAPELATASRHKLNVKVILFNNGRYGTIRMHQEREFPGRESGTELDNPDFVALARSFGAWARRVETTDEFPAAYAAMMKRKGPGLIELVMDRSHIRPGVKFGGG